MEISLFKCTTDKYNVLYARWLKGPEKLLDLAEYDPAKDTLLDLCGGTGAVANEALRRGAKDVYLLDLNPRCTNPQIITVKGDVHNVYAYSFLPEISVCVIRQALGYLDLKAVSVILARVLKPGARLALNGFISPKWGVTTYKRNLTTFIEASGHFLGRVAHVEASPDGIDLSVFRHHRLENIYAVFGYDFEVTAKEITDKSFRLVLTRR